MSLETELTVLQQCLDRLDGAVLRVAAELGEGSGERSGDGLEVRRVRVDAAHLRESVALLGAGVRSGGPPGRAPERPRPELISIPDAPYDSALWTDSDDEGLGARDRHAP